MALDTLANIKTRLGITGSADDALLSLLQASADAWIAEYCQRDFEGGTFTEYHSGASDTVQLRNFPVVAVVSLRVDPSRQFTAESEWPSERFLVHAQRGVVRSLGGPFVPAAARTVLAQDMPSWTRAAGTVRVVYTTATAAVPADVREAYAQLIGHWFRRVKTQAGLGHQNLTAQHFADSAVRHTSEQVAGLPLPPDVRTLLAPYRLPSL
jgi:hypothetical protein